MPAEAKSPTAAPAPLSDANAQTPKKKQSTGKAALARVTLLDGSVLDVTIDVSDTTRFEHKIEPLRSNGSIHSRNHFCLSNSWT